MVTRTAMPSEPPISCPVVFRPDSIPVSSSRAPVSTETATETRTTPRPTPAMSIAGQHVGDVAAAGARRRRAAASRRRRRRSRRRAGPGPRRGATTLAADVHAGADRDGERQERQAGLQRAGAEHVLQVQRVTAGRTRTARRRRRASSRSRRRRRGRPAAARAAAAARCAVRARRTRRARRAPRAPMPSVCADVQPAVAAWESA